MKSMNRILFFLCPLVLFFLPWGMHGFSWPEVVATQLGHCPKQNCDFLNHYLPQAIRIHEGDAELQEGWFYPPTLAILLEGLLLFSQESISHIWTAFNLTCMFLLAFLGWRQMLPDHASQEKKIAYWLWSVALVGTSMPVLSSVKWGQISLCIVVLCWWGLGNHKKTWLSGAMIGLAGALKGFPLLYLLLPLLRKRLPVVAVGLLWMVVMGGCLPLLRIGWTQMLVHYQNMLAAGQVIQEVAPRWGGQALAPSTHRWFVNGDHMMDLSSPLLVPMSMLGYNIFFVLIVVTMSVYTLFRLPKHPTPLVLLFCWFGLLLTPGWQHYFCFLPLCALQIWPLLKRKAKMVLILAMLIERIPVLGLGVIPHIYYDASAYGTTTIATILMLLCAYRIPNVQTDSENEE